MATDVCIPWRATDDRLAAFEHVTTWWRRQGFHVILGDSDHEKFNVSAARNNAVAKATSSLVIVADADTVPDVLALDTAMFACDRHGGVWWPFTEYRYLTDAVRPGDTLDTNSPLDTAYPNSVGGLIVIRRADYWRLGGFDERFTSWGGEDRAFEYAAAGLSSVHRVPGTVYAFNHYQDRNMRGPWRVILEQYRAANRQHRMAEYIAARHAPATSLHSASPF